LAIPINFIFLHNEVCHFIFIITNFLLTLPYLLIVLEVLFKRRSI
jgi:hypothetical protein